MAPGKKELLFKVNPIYLAFGMKNGSHVPHIFDERPEKISGFIPINEDEVNTVEKSGYGDVTKKEVYLNPGEINTEKTFRKLASISFQLFYKFQDDPDMAKFCYAMKDYVTADGRAPQQKALTVLRLRYENIRAKILNEVDDINESNRKDDETKARLDKLRRMFNGINECNDILNSVTNGTLNFDRNDKKIKQVNDGIEPKDAFTGKVGFWSKSTDSLFPHEPSPNDIKQGVGLQDCYCLSVLTQLAANDPAYIKNMLKDNNDGTVTVRFYTRDKHEKAEPVYVTVNKTVNKSAFGQDMYANSSLWVQMIEKAYAKFNSVYGVLDPQESDIEKNQKGMNSMWRGFSYIFMDAIFPEKHGYTYVPLYHTSRIYEKDDKGNFVNHPDYYLPEEEKFFEILNQGVNVEKNIVTTMPNKEPMITYKSPHDVGLRDGHVYTIRGVFEKDGKKFIQLRDPYATFQSGYDKDNKLVSKSDVFDILNSTIKSGGESMGTFNLELKDYLKYFNILQGLPLPLGNRICSEVTNCERRYDFDPLTPDEMLSRDNYDGETFKKRELLRKANNNNESVEEREVILANEKELEKGNEKLKEALERAISERDLSEANKILNNPEKLLNFANQINYSYQDIKSTDEFYVLTNTKTFRNMRDSLKDLNNLLKKAQEGQVVDPQKLADSIKKVRVTSELYVDVKAVSIEKTIGIRDKSKENNYFFRYNRYAKLNTASERSFHRYTSAMSVNCVCSYEKPLGMWPGKSQEALSICRSDVEKRLEMINKGQEIVGNNIPEWKLKQFQKDLIRMQERDASHMVKVPTKEEMIKSLGKA